jgi:hypothetical protein
MLTMIRDDETDTPSDEAPTAASPKKPRAAKSKKGTTMKTTAKKVGRPAKIAPKGKPGRPAKKAAEANARQPVVRDKSGLDLHERVARPGSIKDTLFRLLHDKNKNKFVGVGTVLKTLYATAAKENKLEVSEYRGALNGVMLGVEKALENERGLYFKKEGRGEEFSLGVFTTK